MKKVILLSLLLAPFAACKKDSITEVAQPVTENIETITIETDQVKNGEAADRGICYLYCATRYRATADINSAPQNSTFTWQLFQRNVATGVEVAAGPVRSNIFPNTSTGKNISFVVPDVDGYEYFIKYGGFFPIGISAHTYWDDNNNVWANPVANANVSQQLTVPSTYNFNTVAAKVSAACAVTP